MRGSHLTTGGVLAVALVSCAGPHVWAADASGESSCERQIAADPWDPEGWLCLLKAGGVERLEQACRDDPDNPWPCFYFGSSLWWADDPRLPDIYGQAAERFARRGNLEYELRARGAQIEKLAGREPEAYAVLDAVRRHPRPEAQRAAVELWAGVHEAQLWVERGRFARADQVLTPLEGTVLSSSGMVDAQLRLKWLEAITGVRFELGHKRSAEVFRRQWLALAQKIDRPASVASATQMGAAILADRDRPGDEVELEAQIRRALSAAEGGTNVEVEAISLWLLGKMLRHAAENEVPGRCRELLDRGASGREARGYCLGVLARDLQWTDPQAAVRRIDEALDAVGNKAFLPRLHLLAERSRIHWATSPRPAAVAAALKTLEEVEELRGEQPPGHLRATLHANWLTPYHWLVGRLLDSGDGEPSADDLSLAFEVAERMRAKVLLEGLLGEPSAAGSVDDLLSMAEAREALGADQALLSYQVARHTDVFGDYAGGSWLLLITRDRVDVVELPDRARLEPMVDALVTLEDPGEDVGLQVQLYRDLVEPAVARLPPEIRHLVVVPDGRLHLLSFPALRASSDPATALIRDYEVSVVPSATLWRHWRTQPPQVAAERSLTLADPTPLAEAADGPDEPLPGARREGRAIHTRLGGELLIGPDASEAALKSRSGRGGYSVLHLGAHAEADLESPDRSAVYLAAGGGEDGRLQPEEIERLRLGQPLVVLATCSSAAGEVVRGEGAMSLARAFFKAQVQTVVASSWELRDSEVAPLMERFYGELARGASVAAALAAAQREQIAAGDRSTAWAGLTVLGNGDLVPFPGGVGSPVWLAGWRLWGPLSVVSVGLAWIVWRRRRATRARR